MASKKTEILFNSKINTNGEVLSYGILDLKGFKAYVGPVKKFQYRVCQEVRKTLIEDLQIYTPPTVTKEANGEITFAYQVNPVLCKNMRSCLIHEQFRFFFFHNFIRTRQEMLKNYSGKGEPIDQFHTFIEALEKLIKTTCSESDFYQFKELLEVTNNIGTKVNMIQSSLKIPNKPGPTWDPETILIKNLYERRRLNPELKPSKLEEDAPELTYKQVAMILIAYCIWVPTNEDVPLLALLDVGTSRIKAALKRTNKDSFSKIQMPSMANWNYNLIEE